MMGRGLGGKADKPDKRQLVDVYISLIYDDTHKLSILGGQTAAAKSKSRARRVIASPCGKRGI
jgi:hypothetical protein